MLTTHCINSSFTVSPEMLTTIFPFHFVVDRELRIVQAGDVLQRICFGTLVGSHLDQYFQISRPKIDFTFESIKKRMKSVFVLEAQHNGMCLKGQMSYSESDDLIFFLGSPWITDSANLNSLGIKLTDFAIHDPVVDFIFLLQSSNSSLNESKKLLEDLNQQKNQLKDTLVIKENLARIAESQSNRLQQTLRDLQNTQAQLVQTEKMSGLGQMVAGVAHEINNPVSFIHGNLQFAQEYTDTLLDLIELYQKKYPDTNSDIDQFKEEIDYEFITKDLRKTIASMKVGTARILEIVKSLRVFSRLDESEYKIIDIHEGIDSTLLILKHRIKATSDRPAIEIIKNYGDLPKIECYAGQLNQVFMNLISNAIDALDEWNTNRTSQENREKLAQIKITTTLTDEDKVLIVIQDNGPGIPEEIQTRLFDPFFTTKPVGKGTGLGLSISYQVIKEKHAGNLFCRSELGHGTAFHIELSRLLGSRS
jgi:two-component system, NtrC family, sensor kinase